MRSLFAPALLIGVATAALVPAGSPGQDADQQTLIQWLRSGSEAVRRGDLKAGEAYFDRVVQAAPGVSDGYFGLGLVQLREGKLDTAITSLNRATELNPRLKGAHMFLGIARYQAGDAKDATTALQAELALQPDDVETLTWLGIADLGQNKPDEAVGPLDHAAALAPKNAEVLYYRARAHNLVAEESFKELRELNPDSMLVHRALGETLAASGQPEKAIEEYETAIQKAPEDADLYEQLGEQQQKLARFDAAQDTYDKELKLHPDSPIALYNLGKIDVEHGRPAEGVPLLRKAQEAHALAAPTDFYLGYGLAQTGKLDEAAHWLEEAVHSKPSSFIAESAYYQLARVYQRLNQKEDAERALNELKRLKADSAKAISAGEAENRPVSPNAPDKATH